MILAALILCLAPVATDGDTIACQGSGVRIRLFAIDTPERGQPGYAEATAALRARIAGGLICEPRGASYGRIVALCRNAAGVDVGKAQLDGGFAVEVCRFSGGFYGGCK